MPRRAKPLKTWINGEMYRATVFKVEGRTEQGAPRECRLIGEADTVKVQDGDEFIVAFVADGVLRRMN